MQLVCYMFCLLFKKCKKSFPLLTKTTVEYYKRLQTLNLKLYAEKMSHRYKINLKFFSTTLHFQLKYHVHCPAGLFL